jgi:TPP-dependent trihydroxycyclohexane-1,2-dione (THcHDO) dehydratase
VIYSGATAEREQLAGSAGIPVLETMAGKGAVQQRAWWQLDGIGQPQLGHHARLRVGHARLPRPHR